MHPLVQGGAVMVKYSTPPEAIDDKFIQILIQELGPKGPARTHAKTSPTAPPAADSSSTALGDELLLPDPDDEPAVELPPESPAEFPAGPAVTPGQCILRVVEEGRPEQIVKLSDQPISIGRSRENTIVVTCDCVSRRHLHVWIEGPAVWVEEVSTHRRMYVNGTRMPRSRLQLNDEVRVGTVRIYLEPDNNGSSS
jgi:pSer/pThr/pTyr-binding forkhead associated (FHA) protein